MHVAGFFHTHHGLDAPASAFTGTFFRAASIAEVRRAARGAAERNARHVTFTAWPLRDDRAWDGPTFATTRRGIRPRWRETVAPPAPAQVPPDVAARVLADRRAGRMVGTFGRPAGMPAARDAPHRALESRRAGYAAAALRSRRSAGIDAPAVLRYVSDVPGATIAGARDAPRARPAEPAPTWRELRDRRAGDLPSNLRPLTPRLPAHAIWRVLAARRQRAADAATRERDRRSAWAHCGIPWPAWLDAWAPTLTPTDAARAMRAGVGS